MSPTEQRSGVRYTRVSCVIPLAEQRFSSVLYRSPRTKGLPLTNWGVTAVGPPRITPDYDAPEAITAAGCWTVPPVDLSGARRRQATGGCRAGRFSSLSQLETKSTF